MATQFWEEYQSTQNFASACNATINFIKPDQDVLTILTGRQNDLYNQGINYLSSPDRVCLFK
jgi:hypothetical protein